MFFFSFVGPSTLLRFGWKVMSEAMKEEAKAKFQRGDYMGAAKVGRVPFIVSLACPPPPVPRILVPHTLAKSLSHLPSRAKRVVSAFLREVWYMFFVFSVCDQGMGR